LIRSAARSATIMVAALVLPLTREEVQYGRR